MANIIKLRVEVPATDGVTTAMAKARLREIVRAAGRIKLPGEPGNPADLLEMPTIYFDIADVVQGPETRASKRKGGS